MRICPNAGPRHRIFPSPLAAGLLLLLCGTWSGLASAQPGTSRGTARVLVNGGDRPVEVPAPIQAPPRIAAPSPLPFDRRPASTADDAGDSPDRATGDVTPSETEGRTPIRREEGAGTDISQRTATPMWLGVLIIAGTLAGVLLLVRFGRRLQPGPPELPTEALRQLGQQRLSPQLTLHLMQVGERVLLVGVGSDGARTLTEIDDPAEIQQIVGYCRSGQGSAASTGRKPLLAWASKNRPLRDDATPSDASLHRSDWMGRAGVATAERGTSDG
ncbi:Flagellar biosynthesis protein, FliO [Maioricimonas rarisocia]|uniref:Flagellar biosynthesis protein, FliO n=1 Tax=Maioricimonas rarisocia TaxID=2528026 RepID=A0A517ZE18_9PLAN|nr:flagellar biosynthetic protein FliO [Maioricimonas rarisocia]QDU40690.1 Flagellar biosynthesis protein, FliO [Maioricimonas rarisocia]